MTYLFRLGVGMVAASFSLLVASGCAQRTQPATNYEPPSRLPLQPQSSGYEPPMSYLEWGRFSRGSHVKMKRSEVFRMYASYVKVHNDQEATRAQIGPVAFEPPMTAGEWLDVMYRNVPDDTPVSVSDLYHAYLAYVEEHNRGQRIKASFPKAE